MKKQTTKPSDWFMPEIKRRTKELDRKMRELDKQEMKKQTTDEKTWSETLVEVLEKREYDKALADVTMIIRQDIKWYSGYGADGEKDKDILQQARAILNYCIELQNKIAKLKEKK